MVRTTTNDVFENHRLRRQAYRPALFFANMQSDRDIDSQATSLKGGLPIYPDLRANNLLLPLTYEALFLSVETKKILHGRQRFERMQKRISVEKSTPFDAGSTCVKRRARRISGVAMLC